MSHAHTCQITELLKAWQAGDRKAFNQLFSLLYGELQQIAAGMLKRYPESTSPSPAGLVHESYLRISKQQGVAWQNRAHFLAISAILMRRVLVDLTRYQTNTKRGGTVAELPIQEWSQPRGNPHQQTQALRAVLYRLNQTYPDLARLVELRFFWGLTNGELSKELDLSVATIIRKWRFTRAWLHREMQRNR